MDTAMPPFDVPSSFVTMRPSRSSASLNSLAWLRPFWPVVASTTSTTVTGIWARLRVTETTLASSRMSSGLVCRRPAVSSSTSSEPCFSALSMTS